MADEDISAPQSRSLRTSKRKRHTIEETGSNLNQSSPVNSYGSADLGDSGTKFKRACNECRQQKLRCDVVQEPFSMCTRCKKLEIDCRIDSNFRRVAGKRNKTLELQREVDELRRELALRDQQHIVTSPPISPNIINHSHSTSTPQGGYKLENVTLSEREVNILFIDYFQYYHPYLPLLDPDKSPNYYFDLCPLLGWTIILVASRRSKERPTLLTQLRWPVQSFLWTIIAQNSRSYHIVKALCLLCSWPMPVSTNSDDTLYLTSGIMTQLAIQAGLHQPKHAQDFAKFDTAPTESVLKDRHLTWVFCNIVAQDVSTISGQPPTTLYDWSLGLGLVNEECYKIERELQIQLQIGRLFDKITRSLYSNSSYPTNLTSGLEQQATLNLLRRERQDLEILIGQTISSSNQLRLRAASLHLHNFAFHISFDSSFHNQQMLYLYQAALEYIQSILDMETVTQEFLNYLTQFPFQMLLSATCVLLRILNSSFAENVDREHGSTIFNSAILAIRRASVQQNDLSDRMAGTLSRMWRAWGSAGSSSATFIVNPDALLQLTIRSRMSISHVFDLAWVWKARLLAREMSTKNDMIAVADPLGMPTTLAMSAGPLSEPQLDFSFDSLDFLYSMDWLMDNIDDISS